MPARPDNHGRGAGHASEERPVFWRINTGNGTKGNNTDTDYSFDDFDFELAEKAVEIRDAYVVFEARIEAYADNSTDYTGYELAFDACESPCDADAWGGGAVSTEDLPF